MKIAQFFFFLFFFVSLSLLCLARASTRGQTPSSTGGYKMGVKTRVLSPDRSRNSGPQCPRVVWGQAATACPSKSLEDLAQEIAMVT